MLKLPPVLVKLEDRPDEDDGNDDDWAWADTRKNETMRNPSEGSVVDLNCIVSECLTGQGVGGVGRRVMREYRINCLLSRLEVIDLCSFPTSLTCASKHPIPLHS